MIASEILLSDFFEIPVDKTTDRLAIYKEKN